MVNSWHLLLHATILWQNLNILANDRKFKQKRFQPEVRRLKIKKGPETNMLQDYNFKQFDQPNLPTYVHYLGAAKFVK